MSVPLVPALISYRLLDAPSGASDHHGVAITLDTGLINTDHPWTYR